MEKRKSDVVIIGGGASGLAAAVELGMKAPRLSVLVIEKMADPGRKIRATGNGRCNITNTEAEGFSRIMDFFREIGLMTRTLDTGLVYPYSEAAADVTDLLVERALSLGVKFACSEEVISVEKNDEQKLFSVGSVIRGAGSKKAMTGTAPVKGRERRITTLAGNVILACGGKAGPWYGTTGDGYGIAGSLGHSLVTPVPALTGVECREWEPGREPSGVTLEGTRSHGVVSLYRDRNGRFTEDTKLFEEAGEIQFTKYGLSGICVFNMTRFMRFDRSKGGSLDDFLVRTDFFPEADIREFIRDRQGGRFGEEPAGEILRAVLKGPLAEYITAEAAAKTGRGTEGFREMPLSSLEEPDVDAIASCIHGLEFRPGAIRGWKEAQITMGGVSMDEINEETSESELVPGLYITGELADRDFMCGGFNLSNAWITGLAAADDIAETGRGPNTIR